MAPVTLVLVRHTLTDDNVEGRYTGHRDTPLNDEGRAQAARLSDQLAGLSFDAAWSSDLARAVETAAIILRPHGITSRRDARLREVCLGSLDGALKTDARRRHADARYDTGNPDFDFGPLGGESARAVLARHRGVIADMLADIRQTRRLLVVGHGTALRLLVTSLGLSWSMAQGEHQVIEYETSP